jgi:predicted nuclease with TOPRIM domain
MDNKIDLEPFFKKYQEIKTNKTSIINEENKLLRSKVKEHEETIAELSEHISALMDKLNKIRNILGIDHVPLST